MEPHYPKAGRGLQPLGLEKMLRSYFLQQWFNLSEPAAEGAIYDSESRRPVRDPLEASTALPTDPVIGSFRANLKESPRRLAD